MRATTLDPYDAARHELMIAVADEAAPFIPRHRFPKLTLEIWRRFVRRPDNRDGRHFLVKSEQSLATLVIMPGIKTSRLFRTSAYLSILGSLGEQDLAAAVECLGADPEIAFLQMLIKTGDPDEAVARAVGFSPFEREISLHASRAAIAATEGEVYLHGSIGFRDALPTMVEAEAIVNLREEGFATDIAHSAATPAAYFEAYRAGETQFWLTVDDALAGFCHCLMEDGSVYVDVVMVRQSDQGKGLGRRLLIEAARRFPDAEAVSLNVSSRNEPARRLYAGLGFVAQSEQVRYLKFCR